MAEDQVQEPATEEAPATETPEGGSEEPTASTEEEKTE